MARIVSAMLGLVAVCASVAFAKRDVITDPNDIPGKFDIAKSAATYGKSKVTVKITLYDDVVDSDFTMKDATTPEEDTLPRAYDGLKGNRVCASIERRVSPDTYPKSVLACTGRVTDGRLTGRLYRFKIGLEGKGVAINASRSGRIITLVIPNSKMPKAKTSHTVPFTRYIGPGCENPCYDYEPDTSGGAR